VKQTIAFRVDSGRKIGVGHVTRCITLASKLKRHGIDSVFICRPAESSVEERIHDAGFVVIKLPLAPQSDSLHSDLMHGDFLSCSQADDAIATLSALQSFPNIVTIIVDHYGIYKPWDDRVSTSYQIYKIDDLADRDHRCSGLLDQNYYTDMDFRYSCRVPPGIRLLIGPRYALLRPQFMDLDISFRESREYIQNVMISFGGADTGGYGFLIVRDLLINTAFSVRVIGKHLDSQAKAWEEIKEYFGARLSGPCYVSNPLEFMLKADVYIGAGGTITWERFACGLPGIVYSIARNQEKMARELDQKDLQIYAGDIANYNWMSLKTHINRLSDRQIRWQLSTQLRSMVDGRGAERVVKDWGLISNP
jgi:UDP-2,4-diacetamido-2,4,6-trideoxy-beta-L-altropyranose hydrolase